MGCVSTGVWCGGGAITVASCYFSNTRATGHQGQMEVNYARARQMGLTRFRDTVLWDETNREPDYP